MHQHARFKSMYHLGSRGRRFEPPVSSGYAEYMSSGYRMSTDSERRRFVTAFRVSVRGMHRERR